MDRDTRWERIKLAYDAIVHGEGLSAESADAAIAEAYERGETDEFVKPTVVGDYRGMAEGDVAFFVNFRPDRAREMTMALADPGFDGFSRSGGPLVDLTTMTSYRKGWPYPVAFPEERPKTTIAEVISEAGARQLHVAETEKYAHVTYFFNGGREEEWEGEERVLVAVAPRRGDLRPEAGDERPGCRRRLRRAWSEDGFRFGIINFANPDMVGHTGVIPAAVKAVTAVDACLGEVVDAVHSQRRRLHRHRRPRQLRPHARARRLPQHRPLAEPGAADRHRRRRLPARRRHPRRRRPDGARAARRPAAGRR